MYICSETLEMLLTQLPPSGGYYINLIYKKNHESEI